MPEFLHNSKSGPTENPDQHHEHRLGRGCLYLSEGDGGSHKHGSWQGAPTPQITWALAGRGFLYPESWSAFFYTSWSCDFLDWAHETEPSLRDAHKSNMNHVVGGAGSCSKLPAASRRFPSSAVGGPGGRLATGDRCFPKTALEASVRSRLSCMLDWVGHNLIGSVQQANLLLASSTAARFG